SMMASTLSMRVKANAHQKIGNRMGNGGISHKGMVNTQPTAKMTPTQMAFQVPTAVENCPWRDKPLYSPFSRCAKTMGMTNTAAMTNPNMPEIGNSTKTANTGIR